MYTKEQHAEFKENGIPEDLILTDDVDKVELWKDYIKDDNRAICGQGADTPQEINYLNTNLAKQAGIEAFLPLWGKLVDIGAGYGCVEKLLSHTVGYYPCDLIQHTPVITPIDGKLPFEDDSIDCVVSCNMFQHITSNQRLEYIKESYRILHEKSGYLFIACSMDWGPFSARQLPKYNDRSCAQTGKYFVPIPDGNEISEWNAQGFYILSNTQRYDGFTGIWMRKRP